MTRTCLYKTQIQAKSVKYNPIFYTWGHQYCNPPLSCSAQSFLIVTLFLEFCELVRKTEGTAQH